MWWWMLALALAGTKADARRALEAGRLQEAAGLYRLELLQHPDRRWALRGLGAALNAQAARHLSDAHRRLEEGLVEQALAAADDAVAVLARGHREGAPVDVDAARATRESLRVRAVEAARQRAEAARVAGRYADAVSSLKAARALDPDDDGQSLVVVRRQWAAWLHERGELEGAGDQLAAAVVLSGDEEDREGAARHYARAGQRRQGVGDCLEASRLLRKAAHLDDTWTSAAEEAADCASVDLVLELRGAHLGDALDALGERIREALDQRGRRHVRLASAAAARPRTLAGPDGPVQVPALRIRVGLLSAEVDKGEVTDRRARRGARGGVSKIYKQHTMPVTATWSGRLVLQEGPSVVHEQDLRATARSTARWDGKVVAAELAGVRTKRKGRRTGEKAPAVREAVASSEAAVVRQLASEIVVAVLSHLDAGDLGEAATPPPTDEADPR